MSAAASLEQHGPAQYPFRQRERRFVGEARSSPPLTVLSAGFLAVPGLPPRSGLHDCASRAHGGKRGG